MGVLSSRTGGRGGGVAWFSWFVGAKALVVSPTDMSPEGHKPEEPACQSRWLADKTPCQAAPKLPRKASDRPV